MKKVFERADAKVINEGRLPFRFYTGQGFEDRLLNVVIYDIPEGFCEKAKNAYHYMKDVDEIVEYGDKLYIVTEREFHSEDFYLNWFEIESNYERVYEDVTYSLKVDPERLHDFICYATKTDINNFIDDIASKFKINDTRIIWTDDYDEIHLKDGFASLAKTHDVFTAQRHGDFNIADKYWLIVGDAAIYSSNNLLGLIQNCLFDMLEKRGFAIVGGNYCKVENLF